MDSYGAKHSPEYFRIGHPLGASRHPERVGVREVSIFQNGEENHSESNESRNIDLHLLGDDEFCAILSQNEHRDDPEQVV